MNRESIFFAALLHDIGWFYRLGEPSIEVKDAFLEARQEQHRYCPQADGLFTYEEALWTATFLKEHKAFIQTIIGDIPFEDMLTLVAGFQVSYSPYAYVLRKARQYAMGLDEQKIGLHDKARQYNNPERLRSIFESLGGNQSSISPYYIPPVELQLNDVFFPSVSSSTTLEDQKFYRLLWSKFQQQFLSLSAIQGNGLVMGDNIVSLLHRYACSVPSSNFLGDVSFYDYTRSTSAMALCLYDYLAEGNRLNGTVNIADNETPLLLVGGDLSGIQRYIYDIVSTKAARNLKGRSFYLQVLVENVIEELLRVLDLPWSSVVYASGGGFYFLAPNVSRIINVIEERRSELSDILFEAHQTGLSLSLAWQEVSQLQIINREIDQAWKALTTQMGQLKSQKFKAQMVRDHAGFFLPTEIGGDQIRDYITGEEFTEEEANAYRQGKFGKVVEVLDNEIDKPIKLTTAGQIKLGISLRRAGYWITTHRPVSDWIEYEFQLSGLSVYNYLIPAEKLKYFHSLPNGAYVRALNLNGIPPIFSQNTRWGFTFYGGNNYPEEVDGSAITFNDMADYGLGANKLGILRMDVDGLGSVFIRGLKPGGLTFSRYSTLSRNLDYFFKGFLNQLWERQFSTNTIIIYSGGDDLFIVGHWTAAIQFARQIQKRFTEWVCHNPKITLSGGIAITGGKFPITKGAKLAADEEDTAKNHIANGIAKNAISFLGTPMNWDTEFPIVETLKGYLTNYISTGQLPRGVLQKLISYGEKAREQAKYDKNESWRWHMAYDFYRAGKRSSSKEVEAFFYKLKDAAFLDQWDNQRIPTIGQDDKNRMFLDILSAAARWSELETKNF